MAFYVIKLILGILYILDLQPFAMRMQEKETTVHSNKNCSRIDQIETDFNYKKNVISDIKTNREIKGPTNKG